MKNKTSIFWLALAIIFGVVATTLQLSYMVTDPGNVMNELGGDCGKNYFTFIYHSMYGKGIWFGGMNYPYGEHIIYADGQPVLSTLLSNFHLTAHQALATMNLLIALSYVLAIVFTYKLLRRFGVAPFIAILFACLINMLCPQVLRVRSHFALAYLCLIPMLFYFTLLFHQTQKRKWAVYIFLLGFIMSFMHLYFGAIIFIWLANYILGALLLVKGSLQERMKYVLPMLVVVIGLFLVIKVGVALTDPIKDRPGYPYNSLDYVTRIKDIVSSPLSTVWQYARDKKGFTKISEAGEGYTYLGIVTIGSVLLSLLLGIIYKLRSKQGDELIVSAHNFSPVWLFVAFGSLLMAMGVPFIWNMEWLLNYLSLFKQFRSMGRFSWIFYYITTIYAAVFIYHLYARNLANRRPVLSYAVLIAALAVWGFEVKGYVENTRGFIAAGRPTADQFFYNGQKNWTQYLAQHNLKADDFQAIMLLPFFACGSEKIWVGGDPSWPLSIGIRVATELHLPIVDINMSRTSWSLTGKQVKTAAGPNAYKPMLRDLKSNKPFLLMHFDGAELDDDQKYLFRASEYVGHDFQCYIYVCYPERIIANDKRIADSMAAVVPFMLASDTCLADKGSWYVNHLDGSQAAGHIFGEGAMLPIRGDDSVAVAIPVHPLTDKQLYEFSCWFLLDDEDYRSPYVHLRMLDSSGKAIDSTDVMTKVSVDSYDMWFRAAKYFNMPADCRLVQCQIINQPNPAYKALDEILLRPVDATIISKSGNGKVMVNNHLLIR
jgi:hypothetical protein